ncbi:Rrp15p-domain-containing protein [Xylariales sp. PMI_506]|nr:Rrp15p-domain-containing protein [Xylariales sp. PMI_506]
MAAGSASKKRPLQDSKQSGKFSRPIKKQKKQFPKIRKQAYNSDSDEEDSPDANFKPVNLLDSDDEDLDNAVVDDGASSSGSDSSDAGSDEEDSARDKLTRSKPKQKGKAASTKAASKLAQDAPPSSDEDEDEEDLDSDADSFDIDGDDDDEEGGGRKTKSKRNDPTAFATSLSKILSTKLSTSRRADPLLSRSADAHQASRDVVDSALEAKARRQMRQQKLAALEKGRVRDVLVATRNEVTGDVETSTADILATERRLRKVAQRGVVKLFNAVRAAQVRGQEARVQDRKEGFVGVKGREEKVSEMSRKGFLDLIATGGGGLKKGGLEEA